MKYTKDRPFFTHCKTPISKSKDELPLRPLMFEKDTQVEVLITSQQFRLEVLRLLQCNLVSWAYMYWSAKVSCEMLRSREVQLSTTTLYTVYIIWRVLYLANEP